jgi:hypothetical protein
MKRTAKISFIGPVQQTRGNSHSFLYLQGGADPIKLEYPSKLAATQARNQLLKGNNTHPVGNLKLLQAIRRALPKQSAHNLQGH